MNITHIDHLVLTVKNIEATVQFYESVLGMASEKFGNGRMALKFGSQKINLHQYGKEFEPKADQPSPGSADLCFLADTSLELAMVQVQEIGVPIVDGPVERTGAMGPITSFYIRDPDKNLIEIAKYN